MSSQTMKAFRLVAWGQPAQFVTVPKPVPGPGDILVRMKAAGLCRSDLDMVDSQSGSGPYANALDPGFILGHENAGYVAELGVGVNDLEVGEAVVVHHIRHCSNCEYCTTGVENHCEAYKRGAISTTRGCGVDGGLAEYLLVPRNEVISIGDADPVLYAPLTDAAVTAYHAIQTAVERLKPGTSAAIIGIGGLGSYGVQFIKLLTSADVIAIDTAQKRLEVARELGADHAVLFENDGDTAQDEIMTLTNNRGIDVTVDLVGTSATLQLAARISRPQGRIVLVGLEGGSLSVGWGLLTTGCEFVISLASTRQELREVCELHKRGKLRTDIQKFAFNDVQKAYDELRAGRLTGRAVVVFP
ncbi:uncharacterized protein JN550_011413 [Neoarthrinium moseri]|uniref:uncharacterized protein n=1 Tax=Neoarthrinium moseri TaxID=1658444 RepID=UPI001FDC324B|nr:uncharacterized protein JN550_011413 [Neoarthrinium moseri]KAI1860688.1 hypothetical protein JN550_011413 [Neoarthrinium moseri]